MSVPRPGRMEFTCTMEVFDGQEVVSKHACPAPHVTCAEALVDAAWQALTRWNHSQHRDLKNSIYALYPGGCMLVRIVTSTLQTKTHRTKLALARSHLFGSRTRSVSFPRL
jgi:hypothetical protein